MVLSWSITPTKFRTYLNGIASAEVDSVSTLAATRFVIGCRPIGTVPVHGFETPICAYAAMGIGPS